jgi:hypothetical protein
MMHSSFVCVPELDTVSDELAHCKNNSSPTSFHELLSYKVVI